jgi:hypothetical protein
MEAGRSKTEKVTWSDGDDDKCRTTNWAGTELISGTRDRRSEVRGWNNLEQWTIRGWQNGITIFHRTNSQCCNDYVAHVVHACREQDVDLTIQAVGDTITTA